VTKTIDTAHSATDADDAPRRPSPLLEWLAATVLLLVAVALAWMTLVAYRPDWLRLASLKVEVLAMLGLLTAALLLVSAVALRNTRD
jgi:membrane protein YdbS with pleckstrin-like domain